jgi:hypothetical protein
VLLESTLTTFRQVFLQSSKSFASVRVDDATREVIGGKMYKGER